MADNSGEQSAKEPIVNIVGDKVALGPLHDDLLPLFVEWDNDFATADLQGGDMRPRSRHAVAAFWEPLIQGGREDRVDFAIYERATLRPIGHANLRDLDGVRRTAEFGITIGVRDLWGKGYGTEATILALDYGFTVLSLHNVMLDTWSYNERAIRVYAKVGFREIGRRREAQRIGAAVHDVVFMDCLATEFRNPLGSVNHHHEPITNAATPSLLAGDRSNPPLLTD